MRTIKTPPARSPLIYLLGGLMIGLTLAKFNFLANHVLVSIAAGIAVAIFLVVSVSRVKGSLFEIAWYLFFLIGSTLIFTGYGNLRLPPHVLNSDLHIPNREHSLKLEILRTFKSQYYKERISGIASIIEDSWTGTAKKNMRVYFSLKVNEIEAAQIIKGSKIEGTGVLKTVSNPHPLERNSFQNYLKSQGVQLHLGQMSAVKILKEAENSTRFYSKQKTHFLKILRAGSEKVETFANVYTAMLLGHKTSLSEQQKTRYQESGAMHLFAISGLHIGVIATALARILSLCQIPARIAPLLGLPALYLYVEITGGAPSAMRAFIMTVFFWLAFLFQRQRNSFSALLASALGVLLYEPMQLFSLGFQLSYAVVASILLLGLPLYGTLHAKLQRYQWIPIEDRTRLQKLFQELLDGLALLFAVSFSAWLASTPFSLSYFGFISFVAVLLNMALVNLAALTICIGILAISLGVLGFMSVAAFINHAAWVTLMIMDGCTQIAVQFEFLILTTPNYPLNFSYPALGLYLSSLILLNQKANAYPLASLSIPSVLLCITLLTGYLSV